MQYISKGQIKIQRTQTSIAYESGIQFLPELLNTTHGAVFSSSFEYPGRYTRWDIGFAAPPLMVEAKKLEIVVTALNQRGEVILPWILAAVKGLAGLKHQSDSKTKLKFAVEPSNQTVPEEARSQQPTVFTFIRAFIDLLYSNEEPYLGLYGAFGYDLVFQFERLNQKLTRAEDQRDMVLYLPDEIYVMDHRKKTLERYTYEFSDAGQTTKGLSRKSILSEYQYLKTTDKKGDHVEGEYAKIVEVAKEKFKKGDLFEVVPGQTFLETYHKQPAALFETLKAKNPAPYGFMINLGQGEFLVGASPEMYVSVKNGRVETCPISGTIKRGTNPIEDAKNIQTLLNSTKEASELTMCTDVDRNDKSRVCEAGSVKVIGRRQIEMYSRLIHTVDHVEGYLRPEYDALDAFLSHMWVVTVTGAPKIWAMQFIENHEKSPRRWYAGAVGWLNFNGNINTGLTLRTVRLKDGIAEIRAGATLLYDSDPQAEEAETQLKASAFLNVLRENEVQPDIPDAKQKLGENLRILLVDHQDSFVHTLANYFRQTGAAVMTLRAGFCEDEFIAFNPDLVVLSPGPGSPQDFNTKATLELCLEQQKPVFGVCLGLQAIVEYFEGELQVLDYPMHGKPDEIHFQSEGMFANIQSPATIARYHSLYIHQSELPETLVCDAQTEDNIVMALSHKSLPLKAVQFHPESILSMENEAGIKIIENVVKWAVQKR